jgi:hypothetical protein
MKYLSRRNLPRSTTLEVVPAFNTKTTILRKVIEKYATERE